jgi:fumarate reductase subunit D
MIASNLLLSLFVLVIALRFPLGWPFSTSAAALCMAMLCFSLGPGALTFVVVSEMLPLYMCATSQASAAQASAGRAIVSQARISQARDS